MVISVATQKGGTGKTTTSLALAAGLGISGKKVFFLNFLIILTFLKFFGVIWS